MADEVSTAGLTLALAQIEPLFAQAAAIILPLEAILEVANAIDQLIVTPAGAAKSVLVLLASIDHARSSLQLILREALDTDPAVGLETALL